MVAGVIRGSSADHRDNPVFEFAPGFPDVGRRGDGVIQGFDGIVHLVRIERLPAPRAAAEGAVVFGVRGESENRSHGDPDLPPETPAGAGLVVRDVIVRVRPGRPRDPAGGSRHLDHSEPSTTALRIEVGRIVRKAEGCTALRSCRGNKAGGPVTQARPQVAADVAAETPATASGRLRTIP